MEPETIITSPTRGEKYTWADVLKKGLIRSTLKTKGEFFHLHTCFYESQDLVWSGEIRVSESRWSDSVGFLIEGDIPFHLTEGKRLELGWGCGCDRDYHGQFPDENFPTPEKGKWNEYQQQETFGQVIAYLPENEEAWDSLFIEKILEDDSQEGRELKRLLEAILKEVILQKSFCSHEEAAYVAASSDSAYPSHAEGLADSRNDPGV